MPEVCKLRREKSARPLPGCSHDHGWIVHRLASRHHLDLSNFKCEGHALQLELGRFVANRLVFRYISCWCALFYLPFCRHPPILSLYTPSEKANWNHTHTTHLLYFVRGFSPEESYRPQDPLFQSLIGCAFAWLQIRLSISCSKSIMPALPSRPLPLTERHRSENGNHGLDACFSVEFIYYINSSMTVLHMIVGSQLFCLVFPGRGMHNSKSPSPLSGSSVDTFVPFPSTLTTPDYTSTSTPRKSHERTNINPIRSCLPHLWKFQARAGISISLGVTWLFIWDRFPLRYITLNNIRWVSLQICICIVVMNISVKLRKPLC